MNKNVKIILILIIVLVWMFGIFKLSGMTSKNSNGKSTDILSTFIEKTLNITNNYGITNSYPSQSKIDKLSQLINPPIRKVIHASVYFILAFIVIILINILLEHNKYHLSIILTLCICIIFAITDEYHQTFIDGRTGQMLDVVIDTIGAIFGILFYTTYNLVYKMGYKKGLNEINIK